MRSVAINVGANTNEPGVRGPLYPDGGFEYVPIPESEPTSEPVPTYADLGLDTGIPERHRDSPVHLDPEFPESSCCERYTYGDEHGVKAGPLTTLAPGDYVFFYATLATDGDRPDWAPPEWGAFLIGHFRLAVVLTGEAYEAAPDIVRRRFANNAHVKRETVDARVLLAGDPAASALYETAVPLSARGAGTEANRVVTTLSNDSGNGPWWRRPLRFEPDATARLLAIRETGAFERCFAD